VERNPLISNHMATITNLKKGEAEANPKKYKIISTKKAVEVKITEKHPAHKRGKTTAFVPAHMVEHLAKKGMIEAPKKPKE